MRPEVPSGLPEWLAPCWVVVIVLLALQPSRPHITGGDEPATEFSTQRAVEHLRVIAAEPHPTESSAHEEVRQYLLEQLRAIGGLEIHDSLFQREDLPELRNVAARLRGRASTGAVLIGAHYDSVPNAPGAGDNGAAVASALEVLRALRSGDPPRNDVIVLFSDGEELGLLGAQVFVKSTPTHPWKDDVRLVLNFDARGNAGPTLMYETSPLSGGLVREFARTVSHPVASSIMAGVYQKMPNSTDFTVFSAAGYPGLNFAFIGGYQAYHDPSDTVENLDLRTLTHHGTTMLALARRFGDAVLPFPSDDDVVYFNPAGSWLLLYPAWLVWPFTFALLVLWVGAAALGVRAGRVRPRRIATALGALLAATAVSLAGCAVVVVGGLLALRGGWSPTGKTGSDGLFFVAMTLLATAVTCAVLRRASRRCSVDDLALGTGAAWVLLLLLSSLFLPGGTGLISWALAPCLLALLVGYGARQRGGPRVGLYLASTVPALAVMAPLVSLFFQAMMLGKSVVPVPLIVLTVGLLWPVLHRVAGKLSGLAFAGAVVLWLVAMVA